MFLDVAVVVVVVILLMWSVGCFIVAVDEADPGLFIVGILIVLFTFLLLHFMCVNNVISICPASYTTGCSK